MDVNRVNILYLDKDTANRKRFQADFEPFYHVFVCETPGEALAIMAANAISVAVVDQDTPEENGIKFFETMLTRFPDVIRILVSNSNDASVLIEAINASQIFRYITKPWDAKELKQSMDVAIKIHDLDKRNHENITRMQEESLKMQRIIDMFRKHVPGLNIDQTLNQAETLFGGEELYICALFVNIDGLNTLIERTPPPKVLQYLNQYFSLVSNSIVEHKGIIDKFIGGSMLALFGAPVAYTGSEKNAVFCSLDILKKLAVFNEKYSKDMGFQTRLNIGIHCGDAVVGNIGSQKYISYTAIGSTVNIASRIAEIAKISPDAILISASMFSSVKDEFRIEFFGEKKVRGKDQPIDIYQVIDKARYPDLESKSQEVN